MFTVKRYDDTVSGFKSKYYQLRSRIFTGALQHLSSWITTTSAALQCSKVDSTNQGRIKGIQYTCTVDMWEQISTSSTLNNNRPNSINATTMKTGRDWSFLTFETLESARYCPPGMLDRTCGQVWISFSLQTHHICLHLVSVHQTAPPLTNSIHLIAACYSFIDPGWKAELAYNSYNSGCAPYRTVQVLQEMWGLWVSSPPRYAPVTN